MKQQLIHMMKELGKYLKIKQKIDLQIVTQTFEFEHYLSELSFTELFFFVFFLMFGPKLVKLRIFN